MNFNEEFAQLNLGGKIVVIKDEDKGTSQDYANLEAKATLNDADTTRMVRESQRNAKSGLPCGSIPEKYSKLHKACKKYPAIKLTADGKTYSEQINPEYIADTYAENGFVETFCLSDEERAGVKQVRSDKKK